MEVRVDAGLLVNMPFYVPFLALVNLAQNALDAVGDHGSIEIVAEDLGNVIACYVRDNGPGIPTENVGLVFKSGYSTKGSRGVGLYQLEWSLRDHGGAVQITSHAPGLTQFTLYLPKMAGSQQ
jgi:sensor histidine kinase regulating citrate/malate metabolism